MVGAETAIGDHGLDPKLRHLVNLRASQINGCAFCVKMHTGEARRDGETADRLDRLIVWQHVDDFSEREKAALAWTEALTYLDRGADHAAVKRRLALTYLDRGADHAAVKRRLAEHFADPQIAAPPAPIALHNPWNRPLGAHP